MSAVLKFLIVEDSVDDTELVLRQIKKAGINCTYDRVDTERDMIRCLEQKEWDAIISDYSMPRFNAISALSVAKRVKPNVPSSSCLVLSVKTSPSKPLKPELTTTYSNKISLGWYPPFKER